MKSAIYHITGRAAGLLLYLSLNLCAQQISIGRIEQITGPPDPYELRQWKTVARQYDSLIFNPQLSGQYLPVIRINKTGINYPSISTINLNTFIGTNYLSSSEAINVIPAVISGRLAGNNKRSQYGYDWVMMCRDYFNLKNGQNVYLNHPSAQTGNDWWYETMPNVFFIQLYALYPDMGDFHVQLMALADRWLEAVNHMGGSTTPWSVPEMNYRAFDLRTMKPNNSGVPEPEAAGAIAYILYNAYKITGADKYRIGAEWCLEFLDQLQINPSYELQLPYGVYTAARMNAELGTDYNIEKMINWCFDISPLRSWGMIKGRWGKYSVDGLIGEVNGNNDYAFLMNTFQLASALVPAVRYDDRFARAIGKWLLHASNSARLFYSSYLPDINQDNEAWSKKYDPSSVIAYEALRQFRFTVSPHATGDAMAGGWSNTNLALYASSHAGIFGAIIDTTDVRMILNIDVAATDYWNNSAYPAYLYYNPYSVDKDVSVRLSETGDIYDAVNNKIMYQSVSGNVKISIPADQAVLLVILPSGSIIEKHDNKAYVDGTVIDHNAGNEQLQHPPRIKSLSADSSAAYINGSVRIYCTAGDIDGGPLVYDWKVSKGELKVFSDSALFTAPSEAGEVIVSCVVRDNSGYTDSAVTVIKVRDSSSVSVGSGGPVLPVKTELFQNYPNPFNSSASISYQLTSDGVVRLSVCDILGREVAVLEDGYRKAGTHLVRFNKDLPGGVYFYTLYTETVTISKKMVLLK